MTFKERYLNVEKPQSIFINESAVLRLSLLLEVDEGRRKFLQTTGTAATAALGLTAPGRALVGNTVKKAAKTAAEGLTIGQYTFDKSHSPYKNAGRAMKAAKPFAMMGYNLRNFREGSKDFGPLGGALNMTIGNYVPIATNAVDTSAAIDKAAEVKKKIDDTIIKIKELRANQSKRITDGTESLKNSLSKIMPPFRDRFSRKT